MSSSGNPGTNAVLATWPDEVTAARGEFNNAVFTDFSNEENAAAMRAALQKVRT